MKNNTFTMASLFDGSGGFPRTAMECGINPVIASEVEPYPVAVTKSRFPEMKHYGDVSKINGAEISPVDIITFGSPCQDLSIAGKRAGLKHEGHGDDETTRSGLFMEAVRIIKEMRVATNGKYPRYAIWENVPGAFSSNAGCDFQAVIEELAKVKNPDVSIPRPENGKWTSPGLVEGDGYSIAWRVLDAQFWGVPQRRRRIYLVADFTGQRAGKILFKREGLRRNFATGRTPGQGTPSDAERSPIANDRAGGENPAYTMKIRSGCEGGGKGPLWQEGKSATLATNNDQYLFQPLPVEGVGFDGYNGDITGDVSSTLGVNCGVSTGRNGVVSIADRCILDDQGGGRIEIRDDGISPTLRAEMHGHPPCIVESAGFKARQGAAAHGIGWELEKAPTVVVGMEPTVCVKICPVENHPNDSRVEIDETGTVQTLTSRMGTGGGGMCQ